MYSKKNIARRKNVKALFSRSPGLNPTSVGCASARPDCRIASGRMLAVCSLYERCYMYFFCNRLKKGIYADGQSSIFYTICKNRA